MKCSIVHKYLYWSKATTRKIQRAKLGVMEVVLWGMTSILHILYVQFCATMFSRIESPLMPAAIITKSRKYDNEKNNRYLPSPTSKSICPLVSSPQITSITIWYFRCVPPRFWTQRLFTMSSRSEKCEHPCSSRKQWFAWFVLVS